MGKAKILRLLDETDDIVSALYRQGANKDYKCKSLREKLKAISAEITAQPKSNADRIRQMTDEELAEWLEEHGDCKVCAWYKKECVKHVTFKRGVAEWIKQEVQNNDG